MCGEFVECPPARWVSAVLSRDVTGWCLLMDKDALKVNRDILTFVEAHLDVLPELHA